MAKLIRRHAFDLLAPAGETSAISREVFPADIAAINEPQAVPGECLGEALKDELHVVP